MTESARLAEIKRNNDIEREKRAAYGKGTKDDIKLQSFSKTAGVLADNGIMEPKRKVTNMSVFSESQATARNDNSSVFVDSEPTYEILDGMLDELNKQPDWLKSLI